MAGINVGSVFMDSYINTDGFTTGVDNIKGHSNKIFSGISSMITNEWTMTKTNTDIKMKEIFASASNSFLSIQNDTKTKMSTTASIVQTSFDNIKNSILEKSSLAKDLLGTNIGLMQLNFSDLTSFLDSEFKPNWEKAFKDIETSFGKVWDGILLTLKTAVNGCIKIMNSFIGGIWSSIKGVVDVIGSLIEQFGSLIGFSGFGFSMPDAPKIPMLAKGGIINAPTLAMVGERGREAVMPLEHNTGWMVELANVIGSVVSSNNVSQNSQMTENVARLYIDGKQLAEAMFDNLTSVANRRGVDTAFTFI